MNKKLLAVAVAGALAAPGFALAQASSVTISGRFLVGLENISYSNASATRLNSSQTRLMDNSSIIYFQMNEDLGNGLSAIAQLGQYFQPNLQGTVGGFPATNLVGNGSTWVGLRSTSLGTVKLGRDDVAYNFTSPVIFGSWVSGAALAVNPGSLLDFINGTPSSNAGRTQSLVRYDSPNFSGFSATIGWSANPASNSPMDMSVPTPPATAATSNRRRGEAWVINPRYANGPFFVDYAYWNAKPDAPVATTVDTRMDRAAGSYVFGGFKVGLALTRTKFTFVNTSIKAAERTAWAVPLQYTWGPHSIFGQYTRAGQISCDTGGGCAATATGARMIGLAYIYSLSKRTTVSANYAKIDNDANAAYGHFGTNVFGSNDATVLAGESPRSLQFAINHRF